MYWEMNGSAARVVGREGEMLWVFRLMYLDGGGEDLKIGERECERCGFLFSNP